MDDLLRAAPGRTAEPEEARAARVLAQAEAPVGAEALTWLIAQITAHVPASAGASARG